MAAVAHNPAFAKKVGIPQSVGKEFNKADKGRKFNKGSNTMKTSKSDTSFSKKVEADNPLEVVIEEPKMNGTVEVVDSRIVKPAENNTPEQKALPLPAPQISPEKLATEARKDEGNFSTEIAGTITAVNRDWRFCIINVAKGGKIELNEELRVLLDDPLLNVAKLKVSKIEGRQAVADILTDIDPGVLKPGLRAFRWASTQ